MIYRARVRECAKLACREPASATVALRYRDRLLWIAGLLPERDPNLIDLCAAHADSMVAPYGWELIDDRVPIELPDSLPELVQESLPDSTAATA